MTLDLPAITVTQRGSRLPSSNQTIILALTAEDRTRSRHRFTTDQGQVIFLRLPRGTVLQDGDILTTATGAPSVRITAKPEPVITILAEQPLDLLRAAYHLGNRHVPVEIAPTYLRITPDPVLQNMLTQMGFALATDHQPFQPEAGAYRHSRHQHA